MQSSYQAKVGRSSFWGLNYEKQPAPQKPVMRFAKMPFSRDTVYGSQVAPPVGMPACPERHSAAAQHQLRHAVWQGCSVHHQSYKYWPGAIEVVGLG
jgi:hypothetical protein